MYSPVQKNLKLYSMLKISFLTMSYLKIVSLCEVPSILSVMRRACSFICCMSKDNTSSSLLHRVRFIHMIKGQVHPHD